MATSRAKYVIRETMEAYQMEVIRFVAEDRNGNENLYQMIFTGKSSKPASWYRYRTLERMNDVVLTFQEGQLKNFEWKAKRKAEQEAKRKGVEVGAIYSTSWGYNQTNVEMFQVVKKVSEYKYILQEIGQTWVNDESERVKPNPAVKIGDPFPKMLNKWGGFNIHSSATATPYTAGEGGQYRTRYNFH
jgi:hypothetical protein